MNKAELVAALADSLGIKQAEAAAAVEGTMDIIVRTVAQGGSVTIMGFGTFEVRERAPRTARNPHTGDPILVPATRTPTFRPGNYFRTVVKEERDGDGGISVRRTSSHTGFDA
ncbi:HU family DNA-binding protein [uncultured Corynebacterium sp.]|uniref:HU family DNA-binding protein n=1 Tax=uncultured Corynebacterium sp. TaxID=159447 RepID=UPI0025F3EC09|nr:HU family DNA-binding protein [uncultured Corynebacterium sp.]